MANLQGTVYGHSDCWGIPFDFYSTKGTLATGQTINMQSGILVLDNQSGSAITALTVNLPLNPPDGAVAEISCDANGVTTLTVAANTGDALSAAFAAALAANTTLRWRYSLLGDITKGVQTRTWVRCQ